MKLTDKQRDALEVLDRRYRSGPELFARFSGFGRPVPGSIEGLHATLASLVRHGLARKFRSGSGKIVEYEITEKGSAERATRRAGPTSGH